MSEIRERLTRFLEAFTERVPVEYAALIHVPSRTYVTFTITPGVTPEYFEANFERFYGILELSLEISESGILGDLQGTVLRGSNGYMIISQLSENVILVCGGSDVSSLGITLLKIVELKELIRRRSERPLRGRTLRTLLGGSPGASWVFLDKPL